MRLERKEAKLQKLSAEFYQRPALEVAPDLLGKILVHETKDYKLAARINEVEAYPGGSDKASHTYLDRRTERNDTLYKAGGHLYVYLIYGLHYLSNVVCAHEDEGEGVLLRSLKLVDGLSDKDALASSRFYREYKDLNSYQRRNLLNGPGKLSEALKIDLDYDGLDLTEDTIYILDDDYHDFEMQVSKRIGIDYAEESIDLPYRFYY